MNTCALKTRAIALGAVAIFSLVASSSARAVSFGATSGRPEFGGDPNGCFMTGGVTVRFNGSCGVLSAGWQIDLPANAGSHTVSISGTVSGPFGSAGCDLCTINESSSGNPVCVVLNFTANTTSVRTATVNVPTNGQMYATCNFSPNSGINTINYNQ